MKTLKDIKYSYPIVYFFDSHWVKNVNLNSKLKISIWCFSADAHHGFVWQIKEASVASLWRYQIMVNFFWQINGLRVLNSNFDGFFSVLDHCCEFFFLFVLPDLHYFKRISSPDWHGILKILFQQCHTWEGNMMISWLTVLLITRPNESSCHNILTLKNWNFVYCDLKTLSGITVCYYKNLIW